jgi:hypothetical protein
LGIARSIGFVFEVWAKQYISTLCIGLQKGRNLKSHFALANKQLAFFERPSKFVIQCATFDIQNNIEYPTPNIPAYWHWPAGNDGRNRAQSQ